MRDPVRREARHRARADLRRLHFPWHAHNHFTLLSDGDAFYPRMLEDIGAARRYILLEMYLVSSGRIAERFIAALRQAARRGVEVYVLLDAYGSSGLSRADRARLDDIGIRLTHYNPLQYANFRRNLLRNHRKLLLIDGHTAYTGGAGITDNFLSAESGGDQWHDIMVRAHGPVAADWQHLFHLTWMRYADGPLGLPTPSPNSDAPRDAQALTRGRVAQNHRHQNQDLQRALLRQLRGAQARIWIATAYFIPPWKVRRLWRRAARRGVDVRLLLPGPHTDHPSVRYAGHRFYAQLLRAGVRIYEYQPSCLHAKAALCDDWCSIGSSNMDRWNLRWNLEANQEIHDANFAAALQAQFERDFEVSLEYRHEAWSERSRYSRLQQWFWGRMDRWLDRASQLRTPGKIGQRWMHWLRLPWRGRRD